MSFSVRLISKLMLVSFAVTSVNAYSLCAESNVFEVQDVNIDTDATPPTASLTGISSVCIPSGELHVKVESSLPFGKKVTVYEANQPLCNYVDCPILPNQLTTLRAEGDSSIGFGKYRVRLDIVDSDGSTIACVEDNFSL